MQRIIGIGRECAELCGFLGYLCDGGGTKLWRRVCFRRPFFPHSGCVFMSLAMPRHAHVQMQALEGGPSGFAGSRHMKSALGAAGQTWGRRVRFHCNEVSGSVPVDMNVPEDHAVVLSARHYFKYASGVYGAWQCMHVQGAWRHSGFSMTPPSRTSPAGGGGGRLLGLGCLCLAGVVGISGCLRVRMFGCLFLFRMSGLWGVGQWG